MDIIKIGDKQIRVSAFGEGEKAFVIIPGVSISHVTDYEEAVKNRYSALLPYRKIYLLDQPEVIPPDYSAKDAADIFASGLRTLGVNKADFFGASQGAMVSMYIGYYYPEMVDHLILCGGMARMNDGFSAVCQNWIRLAKEKNYLGLQESFLDPVFTKAFLEKYREALLQVIPEYDDDTLNRFINLVKMFYSVDLYDKLQPAPFPVKIIGGQEDVITYPVGCLELSEKYGVPADMVPGFGHGIYDEYPGFADLIKDFILRR